MKTILLIILLLLPISPVWCCDWQTFKFCKPMTIRADEVYNITLWADSALIDGDLYRICGDEPKDTVYDIVTKWDEIKWDSNGIYIAKTHMNGYMFNKLDTIQVCDTTWDWRYSNHGRFINPNTSNTYYDVEITCSDSVVVRQK